MHQNSPYWEPKSKNFLGRGLSGKGTPPPHTIPFSAPSAPRSSRRRRSTSAPVALDLPLCASILAPSALGVPIPFHLRLEHWFITYNLGVQLTIIIVMRRCMCFSLPIARNRRVTASRSDEVMLARITVSCRCNIGCTLSSSSINES